MVEHSEHGNGGAEVARVQDRYAAKDELRRVYLESFRAEWRRTTEAKSHAISRCVCGRRILSRKHALCCTCRMRLDAHGSTSPYKRQRLPSLQKRAAP